MENNEIEYEEYDNQLEEVFIQCHFETWDEPFCYQRCTFCGKKFDQPPSNRNYTPEPERWSH